MDQPLHVVSQRSGEIANRSGLNGHQAKATSRSDPQGPQTPRVKSTGKIAPQTTESPNARTSISGGREESKLRRRADAVQMLRDQFVAGDPEAGALLQEERVNVRVAQLLIRIRRAAGMTQSELAKLVDTKQSVISRLEQADYDGHSLTMLDRIARALKQKVDVRFVPGGSSTTATPEAKVRYAFREFVRNLRRLRGLTVDGLAERVDIPREAIVAMEQDPSYRPTPLQIYRLSQFYDIPQTRLAVLAGAVENISPDVQEEASRFAAKSESFSKLTKEEKKTLDEFVRFLKDSHR